MVFLQTTRYKIGGIMRKYLILVAFFLSVNFMCAQNNIISMIDLAYKNLDSASYLTNVKTIVHKDTWKRMGGEGYMVLTQLENLPNRRAWERMHASFVRSIWQASEIEDSVQRKTIVDSITRSFNRHHMNINYTRFNNRIADTNPVFMLNVNFYQNSNNELFLCPDTTKLNFNILFFGRPAYPVHYIFMNSGELEVSISFFPTVSRPVAENVRQAFGRIMRKQPKYLLWAPQLRGMNSILYVLNDKIYVFVITEMRAYELSDYLRRFPVETWHRPPKQRDTFCLECYKIMGI